MVICRQIFVATSLAWCSLDVLANDILCPQSLSVSEALVRAVPEGWQLRSSSGARHLAGISLYDGDPAMQVSISPTTDRRMGTKRIASWTIPAMSSTWLVCRYVGTGLTLTQEISSAFTRCSLIYGPGGVVETFRCG